MYRHFPKYYHLSSSAISESGAIDLCHVHVHNLISILENFGTGTHILYLLELRDSTQIGLAFLATGLLLGRNYSCLR